jgi:hypothetical protein
MGYHYTIVGKEFFFSYVYVLDATNGLWYLVQKRESIKEYS